MAKKVKPNNVSDLVLENPIPVVEDVILFSMQQKKDYAKVLFIKERLSQKEVAERSGVSEQTISKWVNTESWERLRKSLMVTKQEVLISLYDQLNELKDVIEARPVGSRYADNKEADIQSKLTASIRQLETDTSVAEIIDVFMKFGDYVRNTAPEKVKEITELHDSFIKSML
jgi:transcriptional regulator with XRE-family HTH domain